MGWTTTALGAREHIDETIGADNIVRRAWGAGFDGYKHCWLHVRSDTWEGLVVVLVRYGKWGGRTATTIKVVDEAMGPGAIDVPDKIWDNRPPVPTRNGVADKYAVEWRANVEAHRANYPMMVKDLTDDMVDVEVIVDGYRPMMFTGWKRHRSGTVPTFNHFRITDWAKRRCNPHRTTNTESVPA